MSDTPLTDAIAPHLNLSHGEMRDCARKLRNHASKLELALVAKTAECDALQEAADNLNWLEKTLFSRKWMPPLGSPHFWELVGHWRHIVQRMKGKTFREAIDAARKETP